MARVTRVGERERLGLREREREGLGLRERGRERGPSKSARRGDSQLSLHAVYVYGVP